MTQWTICVYIENLWFFIKKTSNKNFRRFTKLLHRALEHEINSLNDSVRKYRDKTLSEREEFAFTFHLVKYDLFSKKLNPYSAMGRNLLQDSYTNKVTKMKSAYFKVYNEHYTLFKWL